MDAIIIIIIGSSFKWYSQFISTSTWRDSTVLQGGRLLFASSIDSLEFISWRNVCGSKKGIPLNYG